MPSFFDSMKSSLSQATSRLQDDFARFKNKDVLDATIGACVIVAAADGEITAPEKQKLQGLVQNSALTKVYGVDQVIKTFKEHSDRFDFDADVGRSEALRIIGKQRGNPEIARSIVRGAVVIAKSDGSFDASEKAAIGVICRELGLDPAEFV